MIGRRARCLILAATLFALAACGKRGDPLPPLPRTPQPVTNLKLAQRGSSLEIAYVAPRATAGGVRLGVLDVEILRAEGAGDFQKLARREKRRVAPGESLADTSPLPAVGTTVRVAARALAGGHPSSLSSVASLTVQPAPPAPHELAAELKPDAVALIWAGTVPSPPPTPTPSPSPSPSPTPSAAPAPSARPPASPSSPPPVPSPSAGSPRPPVPSPASPAPPKVTRGFWVYRRAEPGGTYAAPLRPEPLAANALEDRAVSPGQEWCYVVTTVVSTEPVVESSRSNEACVSVRDIVPPARPTGVAALGGADGIEVSWTPSSEADLASYRVYRATPGRAPQVVGEVVPPETVFRDTTAGAGTAYVYTVTALDRAGNESAPSAPAEARRP